MFSKISKELLEIIDRMADLDREIEVHHKRRQSLRDKINIIRARHLVKISLERDDKGKPLYPSERVRQAAVTVRSADDPEYVDLQHKIIELDDKADQVIEYNRLAEKKHILILEMQTGSSTQVIQELPADKRSKRFPK